MGTPGPPDEARLIARIVAKDLRAFETLYRAYHPRLTRFLINMLRRAQLVEEVLNDTLMVVWRQPERYNGTSKVSTWIFAIAYRKALKALRRQDEPVEDRDAERRAERGGRARSSSSAAARCRKCCWTRSASCRATTGRWST